MRVRSGTGRRVRYENAGVAEDSDSPEGSVVLHLTGPLDARTAPSTHNAVVAAARRRPRVVVCDLSGVTGADRAGAILLVALRRQARRRTSCLRLAAVPANVRRVLRECHVADLLPAYDDVGQALSAPVTALEAMPTAS